MLRRVLPKVKYLLRSQYLCTFKDKPSSVISSLNDINDNLTGENWDWVPPKSKGDTTDNSLDSIPIIPNTLLTADEITYALGKAGGIDIKTIELDPPLLDINQLICVTGLSRIHLERMSDIIHQALKKRRIPESIAKGVQGHEGIPKDDWLAIDCGSIVVNFMLEETRKEINLEGWWTRTDKPIFEEGEEGIPPEILDEFSISDEYFEVAHGQGNNNPASIGRDVGKNHYELYEPVDLIDFDKHLDEFDINAFNSQNIKRKSNKKSKRSKKNKSNAHDDDDIDFEELLNNDDSISMDGITINGMPLGSLDDPKSSVIATQDTSDNDGSGLPPPIITHTFESRRKKN